MGTPTGAQSNRFPRRPCRLVVVERTFPRPLDEADLGQILTRCSNAPLLHYSITPLLHYSTTPLLHYSTTPLLRSAGYLVRLAERILPGKCQAEKKGRHAEE